MAAQWTLLEHSGCTRHRHYKLTCDQFDALLDESEGTCQVCKTPGPESSHGKLFIDHDGDHGQWAVRGLLCGRCNTTLGVVGEGWVDAYSYIASPWWKRQCAALGVPTEFTPEPPLGSAIRNQFGIVWIRRFEKPDGWWEMPRQRGLHLSPMAWKQLYWSYGAHGMVPFDLRSIFDRTLDWDDVRVTIRREIGDGPYWAELMKVLGH